MTVLAAPPRGRAARTAAAMILVFALHWATPAGPHEWHWLHLVAQKPLFLPVLMAEEWEAMRRHPESGASLARGSDALESAAPVIAAHHERYDGRGYPAGLASDAIPLGARIVAAVDVYDALTTARPYKRAFSHDEAVANLCDQAGAALDPRVVKTFVSIPFLALAEAAGRHGVVLRETAS